MKVMSPWMFRFCSLIFVLNGAEKWRAASLELSRKKNTQAKPAYLAKHEKISIMMMLQ
jgi:hypothetical protein